MSSVINMLTKSLKISHITKIKFSKLIFSQSDEKIWQKNFCADLSSLSDPLTCWLSICVLTRDLLGIEVTPLFPVYFFRRKSSLKLIFFFKVFQILCRFRKCSKKHKKLFFYFEVIGFESVALDSRFYWDRILSIGCQYANKQSQDFRYYQNILSWSDFLQEC